MIPVAVFDLSLGTYFERTLIQDVGSVVALNVTPGALYTFDIGQDATGGHAFPWERSGSFDQAPQISAVALARTTQTFIGTKYRTLAPLQNGAINQG